MRGPRSPVSGPVNPPPTFPRIRLVSTPPTVVLPNTPQFLSPLPPTGVPSQLTVLPRATHRSYAVPCPLDGVARIPPLPHHLIGSTPHHRIGDTASQLGTA